MISSFIVFLSFLKVYISQILFVSFIAIKNILTNFEKTYTCYKFSFCKNISNTKKTEENL